MRALLTRAAALLLSTAALLLSTLVIVAPSFAHDHWISRGAFKNGAGEWCCGEGDCSAVPQQSIAITAKGYQLFGAETVPFSETQPSPDGAFWRCKRPDGSHRCFFAPPPGS